MFIFLSWITIFETSRLNLDPEYRELIYIAGRFSVWWIFIWKEIYVTSDPHAYYESLMLSSAIDSLQLWHPSPDF